MTTTERIAQRGAAPLGSRACRRLAGLLALAGLVAGCAASPIAASAPSGATPRAQERVPESGGGGGGGGSM